MFSSKTSSNDLVQDPITVVWSIRNGPDNIVAAKFNNTTKLIS